MGYDPKQQTFLLEDGVSQGAVFELTPGGLRSANAPVHESLRESLQTALCEAIPEHDQNPWVVQFLSQDEPLTSDETREDLSNEYQREWHVASPPTSRLAQGTFVDETVTGALWRGQRRRGSAVLYRRLAEQDRDRSLDVVASELNHLAQQLAASLANCDIKVTRLDGDAFYRWMAQWFNPTLRENDASAEGCAPAYAGDEDLPYGADLAESLVLSPPQSTVETGVWWFDGQPHTAVAIQSLRRRPNIGHLTAEGRYGEHIYALFDRAPKNTILAITITFPAQDTVRERGGPRPSCRRGGGRRGYAGPRRTLRPPKRQMALGDKLLSVAVCFYLSAPDEPSLSEARSQLSALLLPNGLQPIASDNDLLALDTYVRHLPMNYQPSLDGHARRSRFMFASDLAALLPVYGRSRGTGSGGLTFFNRAAEPLTFDPLDKRDREKKRASPSAGAHWRGQIGPAGVLAAAGHGAPSTATVRDRSGWFVSIARGVLPQARIVRELTCPAPGI